MRLQCFLVLFLEYILLDVRGVFSVQNPKRLFRGGRHVCMQQMQKAHPVPVRQSYWRSVHTQVQEPCSNGFGLCPRFRVTYQRAFRTVFRMRISVHLVPQCCPGWEQESSHDRGCIKPICEGGCTAGKCTGPNTCTCREGWEGLHCEKDVDECEKAHGCSQECMNQQGSYECACSDGFILQPDMRSCKFCMSCTKEYREMQDTIVSLNRKVRSIETVKVTANGEHRAMQDMASSIVELKNKVTTLEKEKNMLMGNVTHLEKNYKNAMVVMDEIKSKPVALPTTTKAYNSNPYAANPDEMPFDRIASLSEQISLLEERLEGCTCKDYDDYGRQRDSIRG